MHHFRCDREEAGSWLLATLRETRKQEMDGQEAFVSGYPRPGLVQGVVVLCCRAGYLKFTREMSHGICDTA